MAGWMNRADQDETSLAGAPDDSMDRLGTVEHVDHVVGDIGAGDEHAGADVLPACRPVFPARASVEHTGWAGDGSAALVAVGVPTDVALTATGRETRAHLG
jgi:hypothetical protein